MPDSQQSHRPTTPHRVAWDGWGPGPDSLKQNSAEGGAKKPRWGIFLKYSQDEKRSLKA